MSSFLRRAWRHASFATGAVLTLAMLALAALSLLWQPWPATEIDIAAKLQPPGAAHWLGTDGLGRDIFSQLIVGAQASIAVGLIAVSIGLGFGVALGALAAAQARNGRAWVDELVMRLCDFGFAFPALLLAILLTAIHGPGLVVSIVAIGIFNIPVFARITRGAAQMVWTRDFVAAARVAGQGPVAITRDHVLPNIAPALIVQATISFATAILAEAALSYLGLGAQPPRPSWGRMLNEAQALMFQAPRLAIAPGMAIMLSVLGLNLIGDGLRDLLDPRMSRARWSAAPQNAGLSERRMPMKIDFVSDVACPWCAVGLNALEQALARIGDDIPVQLHFQPFELNPTMAAAGADAADYLKAKYGMGDEQLAKNRAVLRERGAAVGFAFGDRLRVWNTFDAHRLLHWAGLQGETFQRALKHALLKAYHGEGRNPGSTEVLLELAAEVGLDTEAAREVLNTGAYADEVREAERFWQQAGIQSVPAVIINERHLISGGQPPEVFEQALRQIAKESAEA